MTHRWRSDKRMGSTLRATRPRRRQPRIERSALAAGLVLAILACLALMLWAARAHAAPITTTSLLGYEIEVRNVLEAREPPPFVAQTDAQVIRLVNSTLGQYVWLGCTVRMLDTVGLFWPQGQYLFIALGDTAQAHSALVVVARPKETRTMLPIYLGLADQKLALDGLWRERCPRSDGACVQLFAAFRRADLPRGFTLRDIRGVRTGRLSY